MPLMGIDRAIAHLAVRQHGLITRGQAHDWGMTDNAIAGRLAAGRWRRVRGGVFLINGTPPSWEQQVQAACLAVGHAAVASDLTAGRLWGMLLPASQVIEVVTPPGCQARLSGVRHHRRSTLHPTDVTRHSGIPVTSSARTLVDIAGRVPLVRLERAVNDALRRKLVRLEDLRICHERIDTGPGRRATVAMRRIMAERAPGFDPGGSDRELWVMKVLARAGLRPPVQQHRVHLGDRYYDVDLAYPPELIALEFDGWDAHGTFLAFHGDRQRTRRLTAAGWRVLPITARTTPAELVGDVSKALSLSVHF